MKIGIDVDGVLTNLEEYQIKYGKKYFGENTKIDITKIDIEEMFGCTKEEREKFWIKYIWKYCITERSKDNASVVLQKLAEEGHELYIITSRAHVMENNIVGSLFRKMLFDWLKRENIPFKDITLCHEKNSEVDKLNACKKYGIDVMIDDKKENVEELSKYFKVLCFDATYNQECSGENIIRVNNWNQIYNEIHRLSGQYSFDKKTVEELKLMSIEEERKYYEEQKAYLSMLPYDKKLHMEHEKNYKILSHIATPVFNTFFKTKVFNRELVPDEPGLIFVANHNNYYDQFPIIAAIGDHRPIHFLTATKMLKMKRGYIYIKTGAISIDRENQKDRENSSEEIKKIILNGGDVFIFPEGRTNRKEAFLLDFKPGAVAIARDTGAKIIPIAVSDNYSKENGELCVRFGEPFIVDFNDDVLEKTEELKSIIGEMKQQNIDYIESSVLKRKLK